MKTDRSLRTILGLFIIVFGLICNEWVLAAIFSRDGVLEFGSRLAIWIFDIFLIVLGLLIYRATKQLIINLALSAGAIIVALIICDFGARFFLYKKIYYRPQDMFKNRWPSLPILSRLDKNVSYDAETYGDLAAMSGARDARVYRRVTFRTDSYGFRDDNADIDRPIDIILIGDSYADGSGASQEKTLGPILEGLSKLNVYNLSMSGYGPWQELINFQMELPRLRMHIHEGTMILWCIFAGNDLDNDYGHISDNYKLNGFYERLKVNVSTFFLRSPILQIIKATIYNYLNKDQPSQIIVRQFANGKKMLFYQPYAAVKDRSYEEVKVHRNYPGLKEVMHKMKEIAHLNGMEVAVVIAPSKEEIYYWMLDNIAPWAGPQGRSGFSLAVAEICRDEDFKFLDLKPILIEAAERYYQDSAQSIWWLDDTHWDNRGQAIAANAIRDSLLTQESFHSQ